MELEILFSMDNAAFDECPLDEAARILRDVAKRLEVGENAGSIRDLNGNRIGHYGVN